MIDILIIGSGAAGLTAALEAKRYTNNVAVLSKTYPTHSQTVQAQGGINAALNKSDNVKIHIEDTIKSSHQIGNRKAIEILCNNAEDAIKWLDEIGVPFSRDDHNSIAQRQLGGTKQTRACYSSDYTGLKILHTLYDQCIKNGIKFYNERMMLNLIVEENIVKGITALNIATTQVEEYIAKRVILATGGYGGVYYDYTTNSYSTTGDGQAVALRAGVKLKDMEYIQFHPTTLEKNNILISESARGEGGYLVDKNGDRFVDELKARDIVARAILSKIQDGNEVFLDLRHLGKEKINEAMPQENRLVQEFCHMKMEEDLIPIHPAAHYTMGGIKTDEKAQTNIKNLYACGECANNGVHGANRLGGNSLLELIVFGKIAAQNASKDLQSSFEFKDQSEQYNMDKNYIQQIFSNKIKFDFYEYKQKIGKECFEDLGLFRSKKKIEEFIENIKKYKKDFDQMGVEDKSRVYNKNLVEFIEYKNILELLEPIAYSALNRQESRGAHYRIDFEDEDENYIKESLVYKVGEQLKIELCNIEEQI
jgi:succinate dehydrogenase / fumarate reductase flavoprotein subunit